MEQSDSPKRRAQSLSKEDLVDEYVRLQSYSIATAAEKVAAEESCAHISLEKDKIKEKALALLKRCRDLEGSQVEFDEMKSKVEALQLSAPTIKTDGDSKMQTNEELQLIIVGFEGRQQILQSKYDLQVIETISAKEDCLKYKSQGKCILIIYCLLFIIYHLLLRFNLIIHCMLFYN